MQSDACGRVQELGGGGGHDTAGPGHQHSSLLDLVLFLCETRFQKKVRGQASFCLWVV